MRCAACAADLPAGSRFCFQCAAPVAGDGPAPGDLAAALGDRYQIVRLLGRGGMGAVHLAREVALDRLVAIKTLPAGASTDDARDRFRREARTAAKLSHPGIVPLHAFGEAGETPYFVMGYVRGESLSTRLARESRMDPEQTREILAALADALDYAHRQGVVHRDVKPDNVLIDDDSGRPMLADFGIAKGGGGTMTGTGGILGTPQYMAPEQAAGRAVDGRTDIYALGVMGFSMLAGRLPFEGTTVQETLVRRLTADSPTLASVAPDVPADLAVVIDRCLARDPAGRWPDGRSVRDALAPGRAFEAELPPALQEVESLGFWAVPAFLLLGFLTAATYVASSERDRPAALVVAGMIALLPLPRVWRALSASVGRSVVLRVMMRPPLGWLLWYPASLRRPGDAWRRLPGRVRRFRNLATAVFVFMAAVLLPISLVMLSLASDDIRVDSAGEGLGAWIAAGVELTGVAAFFTFPAYALGLLWQRWRLTRWARREGLGDEEANRLILIEPTARRGFWSRPTIARLLETDAISVPADPRACLALVASAARASTGAARELADQGLATARALVTGIEAVDSELAGLGSGDADQLARIEADLAAFGETALTPERQRLRALLEEQAALLRGLGARRERAKSRRDALIAGLAQVVRAACTKDGSTGALEAGRRAISEAATLVERQAVGDSPPMDRVASEETETRVRGE